MAPKIITDPERIKEVFGRTVQAILPSLAKAVEIMTSGRRLTFYLGIDPTGADLHLGHTVGLLLLKKIAALGHRVILLFGDFTAQTGDPTDKSATRRTLSADEVRENMKTYLNQVRKVLPRGSFEIKYNSRWLGKLDFNQIRFLARQFTVQQLIARDMFQKRLQEQKPITVEEFIYPLMQGYDSVAMKVDGEIGGRDQIFNMLIGRDLTRAVLNKEKIVIASKLVEDLTTGKKFMSKSEGSYVSLNDSPADMFGKIMALADGMVVPLFELTTQVPDQKIEEIKKRLANGENPRNIKNELAYELVKMCHGQNQAQRAQEEFERIFSRRQPPSQPQDFSLPPEGNLIEALTRSGLADSRSDAKRLINQGGIDINGQTVKDWNFKLKRGDLVKIGSHRFVRFI